MSKYTISDEDKRRLAEHLSYVDEHSETMMGYPAARDFDYSCLLPFLDYPLNNVGDPFVTSTSKVDSREFEREVLNWWADIFNAPEDDWWGYVTNGGTEGNLYGLYLARELHPNSIVYYSKDTHYSVAKNLHFLNMRNIMIRSLPNGEIDYDDLRETIRVNRDVTPVVFANIGTTMTEAKDDIGRIRSIIDELAVAEFYIHSDAAMCGSMAPFLDNKPSFDFADGAHSMSISGHKFIGSPIPCGMVLALKQNVNRIARSIAYIGNLDTTVTGSRNGITPLFMWFAMRALGKEGLKERVQYSLQLAEYTEQQLCERGIKAWRNPDSITVVMPAVAGWVQEKWQLATAAGISHIITMPNLTKDLMDQFLEDAVLAHEQERSQ
ncbi:MAG: histidine decarboxylase [Pseudomonadota bacterium]